MQFIGEETSAVNGTDDLTDAPTWIIDPVDGTTNFVHRFNLRLGQTFESSVSLSCTRVAFIFLPF